MRWLALLMVFLQTMFLQAQTNPPAPPLPPQATPPYLPVVVVNNSGQSDTEVYIVVKGFTLQTPLLPTAISINTSTGVGTLETLDVGGNSEPYTVSLSQLPKIAGTTNAYYFYSPEIASAAIWFSIGNKLNIPVVSTTDGPRFQDPNFLSPTDPNGNYNTLFDIFEYTYGTNLSSVGADGTAVSFFSLPLFGYISTPNGTSLNNSGLSYARATVLSTLQQYFNSASSPEKAQWNNLFLKNTSDGTVLRVASTGKGTTTPDTATTTPFDPNYLDNLAAYGYSYLQDIWYGPAAYYRNHALTMTLPTAPFRTYTGQVSNDGTFIFTSTDSKTVTFAAPTTTPYPTTTQMILGGIDMSVTDNSGTGDGVQVSKLFQEAVVTGIIPLNPSITLTEQYLINNQSTLYQVNSNLSPAGRSSGPWYDLYSKALHSYAINTGNPRQTPTIYSYAYDEAMWPQVLISTADVTTNPETYLGVTLANLGAVVTSEVNIASSVNPSTPGQSVTFTATVTGSTGGTPTGTVTFMIDNVQVAQVALSSGSASYTTSSLSVGSHSVIANYSGDSTFPSGSSSPLTQIVGVQTTVTLTSSENPSDVGEQVIFVATVSQNSGASPISGYVEFRINNEVVALNPLGSNNQASYSTRALTSGVYTVVARYSGNGTDFSATSNTITQVVGGNTLTSSENPSGIGESVTFSYTISTDSFEKLPGGSVNFSIDGTVVATVNVQNAAASYSTSTLSVGSHSVVASYSGDGVYPPHSASLTQVVLNYDPSTTTLLTSSLNPSDYGQKVTFTAQVNDLNQDLVSSGSVRFTIDDVSGDPIALQNGIATFSISTLSVGSHEVYATYSGSDQFDPSTSDIITQVVSGSSLPVNPPHHLRGKQIKNRFATQTDLVNLISWKAPESGVTPVAYKIYSNASLTKLIASVKVKNESQKSFKYEEHCCKKGKMYTYFIVSVDASSNTSSPAEITIPNRNH